jgi:hypothetical protein
MGAPMGNRNAAKGLSKKGGKRSKTSIMRHLKVKNLKSTKYKYRDRGGKDYTKAIRKGR